MHENDFYIFVPSDLDLWPLDDWPLDFKFAALVTFAQRFFPLN